MPLVELLSDQKCVSCKRALRGRSGPFHEPAVELTKVRRLPKRNGRRTVWQAIGYTVTVLKQSVTRRPGLANLIEQHEVLCFSCSPKAESGLAANSWRPW